MWCAATRISGSSPRRRTSPTSSPRKERAATNLNLITASGAIYSFLLRETGRDGEPDLKVYVNADPNAARAKPKYYSAADVRALEARLAEAGAEVDAATRRADEAIAAFRQEYPLSLQFPYGTPKYDKPFYVRAIWHDDRFTYIKADARELPALYEVTDGKPAVVSFHVQAGTYVVPKILERGYLALGKDRFRFQQGR